MINDTNTNTLNLCFISPNLSYTWSCLRCSIWNLVSLLSLLSLSYRKLGTYRVVFTPVMFFQMDLFLTIGTSLVHFNFLCIYDWSLKDESYLVLYHLLFKDSTYRLTVEQRMAIGKVKEKPSRISYTVCHWHILMPWRLLASTFPGMSYHSCTSPQRLSWIANDVHP